MTDASETLGKTQLFSGLTPEALKRLAAAARVRAVEKGEVLFQQGDPSDRIYVLASGSATLSILSEDGHELIIHVLEPGTVFGEVAILDGRNRTVTCTVRDAGTVVMLDRGPFLAQLEEPTVARAVIDRLCAMLRLANDKVDLLAHKPLRARLAHVLLAEARSVAGRLELRRTQQELAHTCGGARPRINQILRGFEEEGLISKAGRVIVLVDLEGLEFAAQSTGES